MIYAQQKLIGTDTIIFVLVKIIHKFPVIGNSPKEKYRIKGENTRKYKVKIKRKIGL